jgi:hypothetical protein
MALYQQTFRQPTLKRTRWFTLPSGAHRTSLRQCRDKGSSSRIWRGYNGWSPIWRLFLCYGESCDIVCPLKLSRIAHLMLADAWLDLMHSTQGKHFLVPTVRPAVTNNTRD